MVILYGAQAYARSSIPPVPLPVLSLAFLAPRFLFSSLLFFTIPSPPPPSSQNDHEFHGWFQIRRVRVLESSAYFVKKW